MRLRYKYHHPTDTELSVRYEQLPGHYGQSRIVKWKGQEYVIGAGTSDSVMYYRDLDDPDALYVLTRNFQLGYIGLERLHADYAEPYPDTEYLTPDPTDTFFTQQPEELKDYGKPLMDMAEHNQIRYMTEWLT